MLRKSKYSFLLAVAAILFISPSSHASSFSWTPGNTDIVINPDSLQLTVDGITATVQAFTAEINDTNTEATVIGPWPTSPGLGNFSVFGVDVLNLGVASGQQLGLLAQPGVGVPANGSDFFAGGLASGFKTNYSTPVDAPNAFHFAMFSFDQLVDIPGVTVDDVSNFDRNIWMATGMSAPNFDSGFLSGIADFDVTNSEDDSGDGLFTHNLGAIGIRHLLVGAPPIVNFGPLSAGNSQFLIDSFDGTLSTSPSAIPLPPAVLLFGTALIGLVGFSKQRKAA